MKKLGEILTEINDIKKQADDVSKLIHGMSNNSELRYSIIHDCGLDVIDFRTIHSSLIEYASDLENKLNSIEVNL